MKRNKEIIEINELSEATKVSMRTRIITALIAVVAIFPCAIVGDWFFAAIIAVACIISAHEIIHCAKPKHSRWLTIICAILILLLTFWPLFRQIFNAYITNIGWKLWTSFTTLYVSIIVLFIALFISFFFVVVDKNTSVSEACFIFTASVIVAFGFQCMLYLRYFPMVNYNNFITNPVMPDVPYFNMYENLRSSLLFMFIIGTNFVTDIGAYFIGVFFGKHKMNERISPKKTWEGFVGGFLIASILSVAIGLTLSYFGIDLLEGILDIEHWYFIVGLSVFVPLFATLGDFVFSSFKRTYNIKDFGSIMPGHGGVLDRCDSLFFSCIIAAIFICIISGGESPLL